MRLALGGWLVVGMLLPLLNGARADDAGDARAVIDKAVKATGADKLKKFKAMTWKEKGTYHGMGAPLPYTGSYALEWPTRFRMEIEHVFTTVVNGDKGWVQSKGETKELPKEHLEAHKENLAADYATRLFPLQGKGYTLTPVAEIKVGEKPAVGVKAEHEGRPDVTLYFDKETSLLAKMVYKVHSGEEKGKVVTQETYFTNYKEVEGIKFPAKVVMKRDGKDYVEAELYDVKPLEKLDAKTFEKP